MTDSEKIAKLEAMVERYAALAQQNPQPASSVEITVSAKGVIQPTVKVYHPDPEYALADAQRLFLVAQTFALEHGTAPA